MAKPILAHGGSEFHGGSSMSSVKATIAESGDLEDRDLELPEEEEDEEGLA